MKITPSIKVIARLCVASAGVALLGACATSATVTASPSASASVVTSPSNPPASNPPVSAPASGPASAPVSAPAQTSTAGYDKAKAQWTAGASAISAQQGLYWTKAAADLVAGEATDSDTTGYSVAAKALVALAALPDAQQTPVQNAEFRADVAALNLFFHTSGLYT